MANRVRKRVPAAQARKRALRNHKALRWVVQLCFFALAPGVFSGALSGVKNICGQIGALQPVELSSFVLLLVAVCAFTVVAGRFFCGYACAFGLLGDAVYALFAFLRSKLRIPELVFPEKLVKCLQLLKYLVLAAICVLCFFAAYSTFSDASPWTAFASLIAGSTEGVSAAAFVMLAFIVVGMALRKRFFCQFLCPMGAVFALLPVLPFSSLNRKKELCPGKCGQCHKRCPVSIWPDRGALESGECIACGDCAVGCPTSNIGVLRIEQNPPQRKPKHLLKGSSWGAVVVKALALLAILWLIGSVRFVPGPAEVLPFALPWLAG